jgi:hypothetical protein
MDFFPTAERGVDGVSLTFYMYLCLYLNSMFALFFQCLHSITEIF